MGTPFKDPWLDKLRDEFAGQAMQGLLAADKWEGKDKLSGWAYEIADAMMEARNK